MADWAIVRGETSVPHVSSTREMVGNAQGAIHINVSVVTLTSGTLGDDEMSPFEESFYILSGSAVLQMAGRLYELGRNDFGYIPVAMVHRWENRSGELVVYLRVRSPQPRDFGLEPRLVPSSLLDPETRPERVDPSSPASSLVGHYSSSFLPEPGPLQLRGFRSGTADNVGVWMLVDDVIGAVHHTLFMVQLAPSREGKLTLGGQHYHPFEEIYYMVEGNALAHVEDETHEVRPGDVVFAGVNALHGFSNLGKGRVRWIEAQAPAPPASGAFFFPAQWSK